MSPLPHEHGRAVLEDGHDEGRRGGPEPPVLVAAAAGHLDVVDDQGQPPRPAELPRRARRVGLLGGVLQRQTLRLRSSISRAARWGTPSRKASTRKPMEFSIDSSSGSVNQSSISSFCARTVEGGFPATWPASAPRLPPPPPGPPTRVAKPPARARP